MNVNQLWRCSTAHEPEAELSLAVAPPTVQRAAGRDAARVLVPRGKIGEGVTTRDGGLCEFAESLGALAPWIKESMSLSR